MKQNINKTILVLAVMLALTVSATAYDADNPATYTVNYIIPSDTAFTVTLAGAETEMDFNPANKDSKLVEPDGQNAGAETAWATIQNTGNVNQDFKVNLTAAQPEWVELYVSNSSDMSNQITINATEQFLTGWSAITPTSQVKLYAKANFTNALGGTTSRTLRIASAQS